MVDAVTANAAAQSSTSAKSQTLNADFQTFLTLLTTQLQNQDPLNPTDTAQFTNQLVMYTQAEQQMKTNSQLESLIAISKANIGTQALSYIGNDITYAGTTIYNDASGGAEKLIYSLPSSASTMKITIKDENDSVVRTMSYDTGSPEMSSGVHTFKWDGKDNSGNVAAKGEYKISMEAFDNTSKEIKATAVVRAKVYGLESNSDGSISLILAGNRSIPLEAISSVQSPEEEETSTPTTTS